MEQKLFVLLGLVALLLCAGRGHAVRILHDDDDGGREFAFGAKEAVAGAMETETEPLDPTLGDYENEISHVEFEPELGITPYTVAAAPLAAAAPAPAAGPAPEPLTARNAAAAGAGSRSMKWWLPPSTMPSFPLFPNPGGVPGMPAIPGLPMPGMPFHPIGGWGAPAPPGQAQPAPPAAVSGASSSDPNTNQVIN
ncbi:hypothetical protein ACP70R_024388 [Stipagrostis hirtigluma subsp. patula]